MSSSLSAVPVPPPVSVPAGATLPPAALATTTTVSTATESEEEVPLFELYSAYSCMGLDNKNARHDYVYFDQPITSFLRLSSLFDPNLVNVDRGISLLGVSAVLFSLFD